LDFFSQILIVLAVAFGPFSVGLSKGYTSPALASLMSINNATTTAASSNSSTSATAAAAADIHITAQEGSWIASLSLLGALFGGLLASQLLKFGRRTCLLVTAVPFSASWGLTVFATSVQMIYATAFLAGNAEYS
jgi:facilitated trehalose transporter